MIYLYFCIFCFVIINPFFSKKSYKFYLLIIIAVLAYFAYHLQVEEEMDLYRAVRKMNLYAEVGWDWVKNNDMDNNPLAIILYYIFAQFDDPMLFPTFVCIVCYGSAFSILLKCEKRFDLTKTDMNCLLAIFCFSFYFDQAISNGRIYLCYALISYFAFCEIFEGKWKKTSWVVYVMCCFIHYAATPFLIFRIVLAICRKLKKSEFAFFILLAVCFLLKDSIAPILNDFGGFFSTLASKNEGYQLYEVFGLWQFISSVLRMVGFVGISICVYNWCKKEEKEVVFYLSCVVIMLFVLIDEYQLVLRTPNFLHYLGMIPIIKLIQKPKCRLGRKMAYIRKFLHVYLFAMTAYTFLYQVVFTHPYISFTF